MPYLITREDNLLRITLTGAFTRTDLLELSKAVEQFESDFGFTPHRLTDVSEATGPSIKYADILEIVRRFKKRTLANPIKSAVVAPGILQYGFARMYQTLNDHPQVTVGVFRDLPSALLWVAVDEGEPLAAALPAPSL
jgi:hypothetical protein